MKPVQGKSSQNESSQSENRQTVYYFAFLAALTILLVLLLEWIFLGQFR